LLNYGLVYRVDVPFSRPPDVSSGRPARGKTEFPDMKTRQPSDRKIQIAVIGGRNASKHVLGLAEEVGRRIAESGAVLVCGGLGGVMEAACRGAKQAGGVTIGILPADRLQDANPYVDAVVATGMGVARNALVVHSCRGAVAVGGSYGTLSEIAFALQERKPVVSLKSWTVDEHVVRAETSEEAVRKILEMIAIAET